MNLILEMLFILLLFFTTGFFIETIRMKIILGKCRRVSKYLEKEVYRILACKGDPDMFKMKELKELLKTELIFSKKVDFSQIYKKDSSTICAVFQINKAIANIEFSFGENRWVMNVEYTYEGERNYPF